MVMKMTKNKHEYGRWKTYTFWAKYQNHVKQYISTCDHLGWPNMDWETSVTPCQGAECQNNNSTEHLFFLFIFEETKFVSEDVLLLLPIWHLTKLFMIPIRFFDFKCWTLVYEIKKEKKYYFVGASINYSELFQQNSSSMFT